MPRPTRPRLGSLIPRIGAGIDRLDSRLLSLVLFAVLVIIYLATGNIDPAAQSPDPVAAALPAWTWALHHTLYLDHNTTPNPWIYAPRHHLVSNRTPGIVFYAIPFYLAVGRTAIFSVFPATLGAAVAAAGAVTFLVAALRRVVSPRFALLAGIVVAFGTATWSVSADALWPHGPDELLLGAAMYFLATNRTLRASLSIALCLLVRAHTASLALVAGLWLAVRRRSAWPLLTFGVPSAISLAVLLLYNHWMFGTWSPAGGYPYISRDLAELSGTGHGGLAVNISGALFSTDRGLLVWCPLVVVLIFALRPAWRAAPDWIRISALAGLVYFLVQMKLNYFSGGDRFWSYRLTIEPLFLLAPLLTLAAKETMKRHRVVRGLAVAAAIYSIGTQAIGAIFFVANDLYTHSPWTYSHLAAKLQTGGAGPQAVMGVTVALMLLGFIWRMRAAAPLAAAVVCAPDVGLGSDDQVEVVASDSLPREESPGSLDAERT